MNKNSVSIIVLLLAVLITIMFTLMIVKLSDVYEDTSSDHTLYTEPTYDTEPTYPTEVDAPVVESIPTTEPTTPVTEETTPDVEETKPVVEEVKYKVWDSLVCDTSSELDMLACLIYQEAGADAVCEECRYRVADVVLNRITHSAFPDTMYKVLTEYQQYGMFYWTGIVWPSRAWDAYEKHAVERAYKVASDVLNDIRHSELYGKGYIWQAEFSQGTGFKCCGIYFGK